MYFPNIEETRGGVAGLSAHPVVIMVGKIGKS